MKKTITISVLSLSIILLLSHSVYFEKLDVKKDRDSIKDFDPREKVDYFWNHQLDVTLESALDLKTFDAQLANQPETWIRKHGKAVGITSTRCFLVKGRTRLEKPGAESLTIEFTNNDAAYNLKLKYIFGNMARDAVGFFNIDDFDNTMDFNAVASELNRRIIQSEISKLDSLPAGTPFDFIGAIAVNTEHIGKKMDIVPIKIKMIQ